MKTIFFLLCLISLSAISFYAQSSPPSAVPTPRPERTPSPSEILRQQNQDRMRVERDFERLRSLKNLPGNRNNNLNSSAVSRILALYRKTNDKELKFMSPEKEDLTRFKEFLRQPDTGIIKLAADKGCAENPNIVVASGDCLAYTMPGAGSSYSFRVNDYRIPRLADITFTGNSFQAQGILQHEFFAAIGDVPLEKVNLQTKGMKFFVNFQPEPEFQKALKIDYRLINGIQENGFLYSRVVEAEDNMTYVLRSVAYRGRLLRSVQGLVYDEMDFDKRNDVIVAFRIIRRNPDGSVTILWKQLAKKSSPKVKAGNDQEVVKESKFTAVIK